MPHRPFWDWSAVRVRFDVVDIAKYSCPILLCSISSIPLVNTRDFYKTVCPFLSDNLLLVVNWKWLPYYLWHILSNGCYTSIRWRHNGRDGVSNHQPHDCLLKRLSWRWWKETSKLRVTGLCAGNSPVTGEFPAQRASDAENVFIWWHHHAE